MRNSKVLSVLSLVGAMVSVAAISSTSVADSTTPSPPAIKCSGGKLTATPVNGWRINGAAPWKWDQATGAPSFTNCDHDNHCDSVTIVGRACTGTVKAYVCTSSQCTSMSVAVTGS